MRRLERLVFMVVLVLVLGNRNLAALEEPSDQPKPEPPKSGVETKEKSKEAERVEVIKAILATRTRNMQQIKDGIEQKVREADAILNDPAADEKQKSDARKAKLQSLRMANTYRLEGYDEQLREFAESEFQRDPTSESAAQAASLVFTAEIRGKAIDETVVEELAKFAARFPTQPDTSARLYYSVATTAEKANPDLAKRLYQALVEKFPDHRVAKTAQGVLRRLDLIGKEFPFEGTLVSGEPLDVGSLKGKVVVVDYWATWCGPCVAEIPNLKKLYDEFHDQGFEIVGISLDKEKEKLEAFVQEREIPWIQTFPVDGEPFGWEAPLATKYGINSIPRMFLIDRDGKLVSTSLRGRTLEEKVRELMGAGPSPPNVGQAEP